MIYLVVGILVLQIMNIGAYAYSHGILEKRLASERNRSDAVTAALLHVQGEPAAANRVMPGSGERTVNYRRPVPPPAGLKARR